MRAEPKYALNRQQERVLRERNQALQVFISCPFIFLFWSKAPLSNSNRSISYLSFGARHLLSIAKCCSHCCRRSRLGRPSRSRCWRARGWRRSCSCRRKALRSRWSRTFAFLPHFWEKYAEHILLIKVLENENLALAALLGNLKEQLSQVYKVDTITKSWDEIITGILWISFALSKRYSSNTIMRQSSISNAISLRHCCLTVSLW